MSQAWRLDSEPLSRALPLSLPLSLPSFSPSPPLPSPPLPWPPHKVPQLPAGAEISFTHMKANQRRAPGLHAALGRLRGALQADWDPEEQEKGGPKL